MNPEVAKEVENEIYERNLEHEKQRKRKRRNQLRMLSTLNAILMTSNIRIHSRTCPSKPNAFVFGASNV